MLGTLGLGAIGVLTGSRLQAAEERVLAAIGPRDPTGLSQLVPAGTGFRYYSVTGGVPHRDATTYRLTVSGLVDRPGRCPWPTSRRCPRPAWYATSSA